MNLKKNIYIYMYVCVYICMYVYIIYIYELNHFAIYLKWTQHCKSTKFQLKKKKDQSSLVAWWLRIQHCHCCGFGHWCGADSVPEPGTFTPFVLKATQIHFFKAIGASFPHPHPSTNKIKRSKTEKNKMFRKSFAVSPHPKFLTPR